MAKEKTKKEILLQTDRSQAIYKTRKQLLADNLVAGIAWGMGSGLGATLVLAFVGFILAQTKEFPFLGQIIDNIISTLENNGL